MLYAHIRGKKKTILIDKDAVIQPTPRKDEPGALVEMVKRNRFNRRTIIVLDRGYEGYNVMAHLMNPPNVYFVLRVKHNHSAMREIARLPMLELDCAIAFTISTTQTNEDKRNRHIYLPQPKKSKPGSTTRRARWDFPSPYAMRLRIVRFQFHQPDCARSCCSTAEGWIICLHRELQNGGCSLQRISQ